MRAISGGMLCASALLVAGCGLRETANAPPPPPPPAGPVVVSPDQPNVIPAGTRLVIRTNEAIETTDAAAGRTYDAEVAEMVRTASGNVLIPRGARAELIVASTDQGGVTGASELQLALRSLTVDGKRRAVSTGTEQRTGDAGLGANRRTATMVGGGALLGTVLGAVIGGGTGAAVGAASGAAAGAAAQVLTAGKEIRVPAETLLTFQLQEPLVLQD